MTILYQFPLCVLRVAKSLHQLAMKQFCSSCKRPTSPTSTLPACRCQSTSGASVNPLISSEYLQLLDTRIAEHESAAVLSATSDGSSASSSIGQKSTRYDAVKESARKPSVMLERFLEEPVKATDVGVLKQVKKRR